MTTNQKGAAHPGEISGNQDKKVSLHKESKTANPCGILLKRTDTVENGVVCAR
jgi:hypothetical protein